MRKTILLFALITAAMCNAQDLEKYRWKNRIILLFSENQKTDIVNNQARLFHGEQAAMDERDMLLLHGEVKLKSELGLDPNFQGVILIGKDGGVKFSEKFLVDPEILFSLIDSMPMRKAEMRHKKG